MMSNELDISSWTKATWLS